MKKMGDGGLHLEAKGVNQAVNQRDEGLHLEQNIENKGKISIKCNQKSALDDNKGVNQIWLEVREVQNLLNVSKIAVHKSIKKGKFLVKEAYGNGGRRYLIALSSLPPEAQVKYIQANNITKEQLALLHYTARLEYAKKVLPHPEDGNSPSSYLSSGIFCDADVEAKIYSSAPEWARYKADKYLNIIRLAEGMKGAELKEFIKKWNEEHPEFRTSYQRVMDARQKYKEMGVAGLLAQYGKRAGATVVKDEDFEIFKSLYLKEGAPSAKSCWLYTYEIIRKSQEIDITSFPSMMSFLRRLKKEVPEEAIYMARYGRQAWNRKYASYVERDYSSINCNDVWVSDHAQIDVAVIGENGKPCFPWVTAWHDMKSRKWLGWIIHTSAPNSDHIFQSFYLAALEFGIPKYVYIDNGKDYRCRDFAGGRRYVKVSVDEVKAGAMLCQLGIIPRFALPYNAQSKTIERDFLKIKEYFSKHMTGYRGGNVVERPEVLKKEIKEGLIMHLNEFKEVFNKFVKEFLNNFKIEGGIHNNMSPNELWMMEVKEIRKVSKDALKLFCMRSSKPLRIGRNGIYDSETGWHYWGEWMAGLKGQYVYMRRDPEKWQTAWCFNADNDEYLGKAVAGEFMAPALAEVDVEKEEVKNVMRLKRQQEKIVKNYVAVTRGGVSVSDVIVSAGLSGAEYKERSAEVIRLVNSKMDKVVMRERECKSEHKIDYSKLNVPEEVKKKKIFLFETDKNIEEGL